MNVQAKTRSAPIVVQRDVIITEPSAGRIAHAIAAYPYTALAATMDIVDNSVENEAHGVSVAFETKIKAIERIVITDNGTGISPENVDEVLRAGSRTAHLYRSTSLSRFGIGLKGAGFSLAGRITLYTRNGTGGILRRSIDQAHIEATDRWEQDARKPSVVECKFFEEALAALPGPKDTNSGTVVVLENVKLKTRDLSKLRNELVRGAGETYSKFLAGNKGGIRRLSINIDNVAVAPLDPLHREDPGTQLIYKREKIDFEDGTSAFFTAVSLPHPNSVAAEVARRYRYHQKNQGIYVYRNGRLIRAGETFGLFSRDFHLNAFRAELEYDSSADRHLPADVAKSTIVPDDEAEAKLGPLITDAQKTCNMLWRQKDVPTKVDIEEIFNESNRLIGSRANLLIEAINQKPGELRLRKRGSRTAKPVLGVTAVAPEQVPDQQPGTRAVPLSPTNGESATPVADAPSKKGGSGYLRAVDSLPDGVLYRPLMDGEVGLVVEVNISHPFAKAIFEAAGSDSENARRSVPRRATTAIQQLLYVLGYCEFTMADDEETDRLFEQYRRYLAMNLSALLD